MAIHSKKEVYLIKYFKRGIRKLNDPTQYASGAIVEAVLLDKNSQETNVKFVGRVDEFGDVAELNSEEKGLSLEKPGVYLIKYYGSGMEFLDPEDQILKPFSEIYDVSNVLGFSSNKTDARRMVIDYENSQLKWYDDNNELKFIIGFNVYQPIWTDFDGLSFKKNAIAIWDNPEISTEIFEALIQRLINEVPGAIIKGIKQDVKADQGVAIESSVANSDETLSAITRISGFLERDSKQFFICYYGNTGGDNTYFLFGENGKNFLYGKLGIGMNKENPIEDIDVKENISCDGRFKSAGGLGGDGVFGGNGSISFTDSNFNTIELFFQGGICYSAQINSVEQLF